MHPHVIRDLETILCVMLMRDQDVAISFPPVPFYGVFIPGIIVYITGWTAWALVLLQAVNFCDYNHTGSISIA